MRFFAAYESNVTCRSVSSRGELLNESANLTCVTDVEKTERRLRFGGRKIVTSKRMQTDDEGASTGVSMSMVLWPLGAITETPTLPRSCFRFVRKLARTLISVSCALSLGAITRVPTAPPPMRTSWLATSPTGIV